MDESLTKPYFAVLTRDETGSWHQPMKPLREWHRDKMIEKARDEARTQGCGSFILFDADEQRIHSGDVDHLGT